MQRTTTLIGPKDHGRRIDLEDYIEAEFQEGYLYELGRGVIVVSEVPGYVHFAMLCFLRNALMLYQIEYPQRIHSIGGGSEARVEILGLVSERHPDISVYKNGPPPGEGRAFSLWVPDFAIEIVSPGSERRDYSEKREEYLEVGVKEYWIVDASREEITVLRRVADAWQEHTVGATGVCKSKVLPKFEIDCQALFQAAKDAER